MNETEPTGSPEPKWSLYSRHGHILFALARNNEMRMTDLAAEIGVTDRQIRSLLKPLKEAGVITIEKSGRNNRYLVNLDYSFNHPFGNGFTMKEILEWHNGPNREQASLPPVPSAPLPSENQAVA